MRYHAAETCSNSANSIILRDSGVLHARCSAGVREVPSVQLEGLSVKPAHHSDSRQRPCGYLGCDARIDRTSTRRTVCARRTVVSERRCGPGCGNRSSAAASGAGGANRLAAKACSSAWWHAPTGKPLCPPRSGLRERGIRNSLKRHTRAADIGGAAAFAFASTAASWTT